MLITALTATSTAALCAAARSYLDRSSRREQSFFGGRVRLTALWNHGAAFGLPVPRKALAGLSAPAMLGTLRHRRRSPLGAGLVLGGGLSNLWERLHGGRVYDYVRFPVAPGRLKRYVYNLADFSIFFGALLLLFPRKKR